jgi:trimeric autotransporter adhesin
MMGKRVLCIALLAMIALSGRANATTWSLSSRVMTVGGSLQVGSGTPTTSASGTVFKSYTTSQLVPVTPQAATGYQISAFTVNGLAKPVPASHTLWMGLPAFSPVRLAQSMTVSFSKLLGGVVSSATANGSVFPNGTNFFQVGSVASYLFNPNAGLSLVAISGLPAGATLKDAASGAAVTLPYPGAVKVAFTVGTTPVVMTGSFIGLAVDAGPRQTVPVGTPVTLAGSSVIYDQATSVSYAWTQRTGVAVVLSGAGTPTPSFTPVKAGNYQFTLVATDSTGTSNSDTASVIVFDSPAATAQRGCQACHTQSGVAPSVNVFGKWSSSRHRAGLVLCERCHLGADNGSHPGPALTSPVLLNSCNGCHLDGAGNFVGVHPVDRGTGICAACHDPHSLAATNAAAPASTHFNNVTSAGYPASFVSSRASCSNCHNNDPGNLDLRKQWEHSAHAALSGPAWSSVDFKTKPGCVQCHSTTGFIAYSTGKNTGAWGVASDKTKEVLSCVGCHKDISSGALRTVSPVQPFADEGYTNRNLGESNLCMNCHSGTNNGSSIQVKVGSALFTDQGFIAPHYGAAGAILHGKAGYHFPGQSYQFYSSNSHRGVGIANNNATGSSGPCIACHKDSASGHSFQAAVTASAVCANCHGSSLSAADLFQAKADFSNGLVVLKAMLNAKGFSSLDKAPYFDNTDWGSDQSGANAMGAAFNYVVLLEEPGAYAHNGAYSKKLVSDSIDYLYNGSVTGSINSALSFLVARGAITQAAADALAGSQTQTGCSGCHSFTAGSAASHNAHLGAGILCAGCHSKTAASGSALVPATTLHANGVVNVDFAAGSPGSYSGGKAGTCSGVSCHSNGLGTSQSPVWGSAGPLTCKSCHPVLGGAHPAHIGNLLDSAAFYSYTGNYSTGSMYRFGCSNCHPTDQNNHADGRVDLTLARDQNAGTLRNLNDPALANTGVGNTGSGVSGTSRVRVVCSAVYCHSNGWQSGSLSFAASPDWYNAGAYSGDRCAMCHGNSPNGSIPGSAAHTVHVVGIHSLNVFSGGFGNLTSGNTGNVGHGSATQSTTLNCNMCHFDTVTGFRNDANSACSGCHKNQGNPLQIANKALHVNGQAEVSFANISVVSKAQLRPESFAAYSGSWWTRNGGNYKNGPAAFDTSRQTLRHAAGWDGASCSNVACHMGQQVQWTNTNPPSYCALCHTAL